MTIQGSVNLSQAFGVPGEMYDDSPIRVAPYVLDSAGAIGLAYTQVANTDGHATLGADDTTDGTPFAGILIGPKELALYGTTGGGTLAPTLNVAANQNGELATMGHFIVTFSTAFKPGYFVDYVKATGVLVARAPSVALGGANANIPGATVFRFAGNANTIGVIELLGNPQPPTV